MNLNMFCHDYWKQERKKEKSDDCGRIDLCTLIRNCKSGKISQEDKNALFQCVICRNSKLRKVWNQICRFIISFCVYTHYKSSCQAEEDIDRMKYYAFHYIEWEVEKCIQKFNPELLDCPDNKNALKLLSKYISNSLHYRIIKEALIDAILPYICETAEIMQMDFPEAMPGTFIVCAKKENNDEFKLICPYITDMLSTYFEQGVFPDHPVLERLVNMGYKIKSGYQVYQQVNIKNLPENVLISDIFSCYQDKGTANSPCARIEFSEKERKQTITLIICNKNELRKTSQELSELIFSCSDQCDIPKMKKASGFEIQTSRGSTALKDYHGKKSKGVIRTVKIQENKSESPVASEESDLEKSVRLKNECRKKGKEVSKLFDKAKKKVTTDVFIKEALACMEPRSPGARQQKRRLITQLENRFNLTGAWYFVELIESWHEAGKKPELSRYLEQEMFYDLMKNWGE